MLSAFRTVRRFIAPEIHDHEGRGSACRQKRMVGKNCAWL